MRGHLSETFAALAVRPFRILWIGTLFAFVGFFMSMVVQSVVAFELTGENRWVGTVVFAQGLMMLTLGPFGGAFADRLPKRPVIAVCQMATMLVFFTLSWALATNRLGLGLLIGGSIVMGASFAFLGPARQSLAVELVPRHQRGNAVALTQVANSACRVLGPALGGAFLALFANGASMAYFTVGVFYLVAILSLLFLPKSEVREGAGQKHVLWDILDGLRYVRGEERLRTPLLLFTLVVIFGFPHITILPGFVENQLGLRAAASSFLFGASALGALIAAVLVARLADSPRSPALGSLLAVGFGVTLVGASVSPNLPTLIVAMSLVGLFSGGFQTLAAAVIIKQTDERYVGRVLSLTMLSFAGFGLMGLPVGFLADIWGERAVLAAQGVAVCLVVLLFRRPARSEAAATVPREGA